MLIEQAGILGLNVQFNSADTTIGYPRTKCAETADRKGRCPRTKYVITAYRTIGYPRTKCVVTAGR